MDGEIDIKVCWIDTDTFIHRLVQWMDEGVDR